MKIKMIPSGWLEKAGRRLDCGPYMTGAIEAKMMILKIPHDSLKGLTAGFLGGIFKAPRLSPIYVEEKGSGHPYLSSTDVLCNDLSRVPLISSRQAMGLEDFFVREGMTLISSSGETGRAVFARKDMNGMMGSPHFMRVTPDCNKVDPGYLFAFLSCKFGHNLITAGTYGSIIVAIEPEHITDIPVPRFSEQFEKEVSKKIHEAAALRVQANQEILNARARFHRFGERILDSEVFTATPKISAVTSNAILGRLDAAFHDPLAEAIAKKILRGRHCLIKDFCSEIFLPGIFKRIYSDDPSIGAPYILGSAVYWMEPIPKGILSPKTSLFQDVLLKKGTILVQAFGQKGGLIGRPTWVGDALDKCTTTHMLVRLIAKNPELSGYLFAFLDSDFGYAQIIRLPFGGSIPHFTENDIGNVPLLLMSDEEIKDISREVLAAFTKRDKAFKLEIKAREDVENAIEVGGLR